MTKNQQQAQDKYDQILHLIGRVVAAWARLDDPLIELLSRLAGCRPKSAAIMYYALDATSTRLAMITGLAQHKLRKGKRRTDLLAFLKRLEKLATTRNDIVHANYSVILRVKDGKLLVRKRVVRSARAQLLVDTLAQTGELATHARFVNGAGFWLLVNGWSVRHRAPTGLRALSMALNTSSASQSKSGY
jgi:hypothetical protein